MNITQDSFQDQNSATESTEATQETAKTTKDFDIGPPQGNIFRTKDSQLTWMNPLNKRSSALY